MQIVCMGSNPISSIAQFKLCFGRIASSYKAQIITKQPSFKRAIFLHSSKVEHLTVNQGVAGSSSAGGVGSSEGVFSTVLGD